MSQSRDREKSYKNQSCEVYKGLAQEDTGLPSSTVRNTEWTLSVTIY